VIMAAAKRYDTRAWTHRLSAYNHGAIPLQHLKAISITTEQRELSLGQWLAMAGQILSIFAQALIGKEG